MEPIAERFDILKTRERNVALLQGCLSTSSKPEVYKFKGDTMGRFLMVTKSTRKIHNTASGGGINQGTQIQHHM